MNIAKKTVRRPSTKELFILGENATCPQAQYNGWNTGCPVLLQHEDCHYHCHDCGLVYTMPERNLTLEKTVPTIDCSCQRLVEVMDSFFDECHGYDCPLRCYKCETCGRHYNNPPHAQVRLQNSDAAKKYAENIQKISAQMEGRSRSMPVEPEARAKLLVKSLMETLQEIPEDQRRELLEPLLR